MVISDIYICPTVSENLDPNIHKFGEGIKLNIKAKNKYHSLILMI